MKNRILKMKKNQEIVPIEIESEDDDIQTNLRTPTKQFHFQSSNDKNTGETNV